MKIGIVVDNYKVERFKRVLTENGFKFTVSPGVTRSTSSIMIEGTASDAERINVICKQIQSYYQKNRKE